MSDAHEMSHQAELWSVRELMAKLEGDAAWTLAVAQRAFEWDTIRVSNLVDSILRGFPIGSLLVAEHRGPHYRLNDARRFRDLVSDDGETTQLLDGQQRCRAILATFQGEGLNHPKTGRHQHLWINLTAPNPRFQEFSREHGALCLLRWLDEDLDPNDLSDVQRRAEGMTARGGEPKAGWIRFHVLVDKVEKNARPRTLGTLAKADFSEPEIQKYIQGLKAQVARALSRANIPIHRLSPPQRGAEVADLHQVFVRLNVGGKPLSAPDEFFAGAKRYWPQAEAGIRPLLAILSPLGRRGAITLLARAANRTLGKSRPRDPYPLQLEVLAKSSVGKRRNPLVTQMQHLAESDGSERLATALQWVSDVCFKHLNCGLHGIGDAAWMSAVAWAFAWSRKRPLPSVDDSTYTKPLLGFVFWTSLLGSQTYGRARFGRLSFHHCWSQGEAGKPVPYGQRFFDRVCFDYDHIQSVLASTTELNGKTSHEDRAHIQTMMRRNRWLFLGPFQRVGTGRGWTVSSRKQPGIEWEHIVPFDKARGLFKRSRKYIRKYTHHIGAIGNFAAIDGRSNRVFNDSSIARKLGWNQETEDKTYGDFNFVRTQVNLSKPELELLKIIDHELEEGRDKEVAGEAFLRFVSSRGQRIWRTVCGVVGGPPVPTVYEDTVSR